LTSTHHLFNPPAISSQAKEKALWRSLSNACLIVESYLLAFGPKLQSWFCVFLQKLANSMANRLSFL